VFWSYFATNRKTETLLGNFRVSLFTFGDVKLLVPQGSEFILYATYVVGEYDFLNISSQVLDAGYRGLGKGCKKGEERDRG